MKDEVPPSPSTRTIVYFILHISSFILFLSSCAKQVEPRILADFNSGQQPNNVGGSYGPFMPNAEDPAQYCRVQYSLEQRSGDTGYALRLDYDIEDTKPAFNGFWMKLQNLDASAFNTLSLRVNGDRSGCTSRVMLELKNAREKSGVMVKDISSTPREYRIALSEFKDLTTLNGLTEFVIIFDDINATRKIGTLYVDDIMLMAAP